MTRQHYYVDICCDNFLRNIMKRSAKESNFDQPHISDVAS